MIKIEENDFLKDTMQFFNDKERMIKCLGELEIEKNTIIYYSVVTKVLTTTNNIGTSLFKIDINNIQYKSLDDLYNNILNIANKKYLELNRNFIKNVSISKKDVILGNYPMNMLNLYFLNSFIDNDIGQREYSDILFTSLLSDIIKEKLLNLKYLNYSDVRSLSKIIQSFLKYSTGILSTTITKFMKDSLLINDENIKNFITLCTFDDLKLEQFLYNIDPNMLSEESQNYFIESAITNDIKCEYIYIDNTINNTGTIRILRLSDYTFGDSFIYLDSKVFKSYIWSIISDDESYFKVRNLFVTQKDLVDINYFIELTKETFDVDMSNIDKLLSSINIYDDFNHKIRFKLKKA